jgi:hypothetical protein
MHLRTLDDHLWCNHTALAMKTLLQNRLGSCPSFVEKALKCVFGKQSPEISFHCPSLFLQESPELGLLKPQQTEVSVIRERML